jgi:prolyl-tRNA synthetase
MSPGWKFNEWEMKGVPLRIEVGPRDIENNQVMVMRRDNLEKQPMSMDNLSNSIVELLDIVQKDLFIKSKNNRDKRVVEADSLDGILQGVENKNFVKAGWCGCRECEDKVKEYASATARVMCDEEGVPEKCAICGKPAKHKVIFARAY